MTRNATLPLLVLCALLAASPALAARTPSPRGSASVLEHAIHLELDPAGHSLAGVDTLRLARPLRSLRFELHEDLRPEAGPGLALRPDEADEAAAGRRAWILDSEDGSRELWIVRWRGRLHQDVAATRFSRERVGSEIRATVGEEGVFLAGGAGWYPLTGEGLSAHRVTTVLPAGWRSVTQGRLADERVRGGRVRQTWDAPHPSDGLLLAANHFQVTTRRHGDTLVQTWFFPEDSALAAGYLDAAVRFLDLYESFLPPYPYAKFAIVENFFPTGYGMPSWTLLGQRVLRLPFIKDTSLGHELNHNWWGNSVFVGEGGNWCEGVTVYTADYLYKEMESAAAARSYRKDLLKDYARYVGASRDFPLTEFVARHDPSSRAIGYGKSMMVFHMLEEAVGREAFRRALRRVVEERQWHQATWSDFFRAVEAAGDLPRNALEEERRQWIERPGAPRLSLGETSARPVGAGWRLVLELVQEGGPWCLRVPVHVETEAGSRDFRLELGAERERYELSLPDRPRAVSLDPDYHLFRWLYEEEMEATLSLVLGDAAPLFVLEDDLPAGLAAACRDFAGAFVEGEPRILTAAAAAGEEPRTLVWLGRRPPAWLEPPAGLEMGGEGIIFQGERLSPGQHVIIYTAKRGPGRGLMVVLSDSADQLRAVARRVPHYGRYSYLAFEAGRNRIKGNWDAAAGPLTRHLDDATGP